MPTAPVNGIDLFYDERGEGTPLLLITGLSGNALDWTPLLPTLAEGHRVIAIDPRGAGRSSAPPGPYTMAMLAADALGLLNHLGIERAHVVGFSLGGMIAQELAIAAPARVDRLVLLATAARRGRRSSGHGCAGSCKRRRAKPTRRASPSGPCRGGFRPAS